MHIKITTPVYLRPNILRLFLEGYVANKVYLKSRVRLTLDLAGSTEDDNGLNKLIAEKYSHRDVVWHEYPNNPVSDKWQKTIYDVSSESFDYLLILGSDDILHNSAIDAIVKKAEEGFDQIGFLDLYFLDSISKYGEFWQGYQSNRYNETIGAGRTLSRRVLEKNKFKLWDYGLNKSMDLSMTRNLSGISRTEASLSSMYTPIADVKSSTNIWPKNRFNGLPISYNRFIELFTLNVQEAFKNL